MRNTLVHLNTNVESVVVETFQRYLNTSEDLPLSAQLLADLSVDSLALVTILMSLAERFDVDLLSTETDLGGIHTLDDVVSLFSRLQSSRCS